MDINILTKWVSDVESAAKKAHELSIIREYDNDIKDLLLKIIIDSSNTLAHFRGDISDASRVPAPSTKRFTYGETRTRVLFEEDKREDIYMVAYWMSKYEHHDLCPTLNQGESFDYLARILGIKRTSLKLIRDAFDAHTDTHRIGWIGGAFNEKQKEILNRFEKMEKEKVLGILKRALVKYE